MAKKTYTESEITDIMGHAAKMQALEKTQGHEGLTIEELKAIAVESGIDPQFVEIASSESIDHKNSYAGIPVSISRSMFVQGSLSDAHWDQMVTRFVKEFGGPGEVVQLGLRRIWRQDNIKIVVEEVHGQVMMNATAEWSKELEMPFALTIVGAIATLVTAGLGVVSMEWSIGLVAILVGAIIAGTFSTYQKRKAARQEALRERFTSTLNHCAVVIQKDHLVEEVQKNVEPQIEVPLINLHVSEEGISSEQNTRISEGRTRNQQ